MVDDCILIVGVGRSGTNWLFDLLDLSARTHCRNATSNSLPDSLLAPLIEGVAPLQRDRDLGSRWDEALTALAGRMGAMDGRIPVAKAHFHRWASAAGLVRAVGSRRLRPVLAWIQPSLRQREWPVPRWLASAQAMRRAVPVLRIGSALPCVEWVLAERSRAKILHMVRHPGGFLNSWQRRFLSAGDADLVRRDNAARLRRVLEVDPSWGENFGDVDALCVQETELLFWRYSTETTWKHGGDEPQYKLVTFESLAADLDSALRSVYEHCGLAWTREVAAAASIIPSRFSGKRVSAREIAEAWRTTLDPRYVEMVDRILDQSPLGQIWS